MGKFNKGKFQAGMELLGEISKKQASQMTLTYLNADQIINNQLNHYSTEDIEELAILIYTVGLKQPLIALELEDGDGRVRLTGGHRRSLALEMLSTIGIPSVGIEPNPKFNTNIPVYIENLDNIELPISDELKELYSIQSTNSGNRKYSDEDRFREYQNYKKILTAAKENGYLLGDKMRNIIASKMKVSVTQVSKYNYIESHAEPEVKEKILEGKLSIDTAEQIAHAEKTEQIEIINSTETPISELTRNKVAEIREQLNEKKTNTQNNKEPKDSKAESYKFKKDEFVIFDLDILEDLPNELELTPGAYQKLQSSKIKIDAEIKKIKKILL